MMTQSEPGAAEPSKHAVKGHVKAILRKLLERLRNNGKEETDAQAG
jgi:hypothetical protein